MGGEWKRGEEPEAKVQGGRGGEGERRSHELFMESIIATPSRLRD